MNNRIDNEELIETFREALESLDQQGDVRIKIYLQQLLTLTSQFAQDGVDELDLKIIVNAIQELRHAFNVFREYDDRMKISVFGSARSEASDPNYQAAEEFSRLAAEEGYMPISGAGPGIMEAINKGAGSENSFGLQISIPFEYKPNQYIKDDDKCLHFRFFFSRKLIFAKESQALVYFPGGFGTHDELFELLCLMQTGRHDLAPLVLCDQDGFWEDFESYLRDNLLEQGTISKNDFHLIDYVQDPEEALNIIKHFYSNYQSSRFVDEDFVIRFKDYQAGGIKNLEEEFSHLCPESGFILEDGPVEGEESDAPEDLYRLRFYFSNQDYGELRRVIDAINSWN